jgi:hypothetical protein
MTKVKFSEYFRIISFGIPNSIRNLLLRVKDCSRVITRMYYACDKIIFNGGKRCGKLDFVIFDGRKVWKIVFAIFYG